MLAMAGMYLAGAPTFESFATGTIIVVAVAVVGSLTVLPALLAWLGDRVEKGGVPIISRMPWNAGESGLWARVLNPVLRHPVVSVVAAGGLLVVLAIPAFSLHLAVPGPSSLPQNLGVVKTYNKIQATFPGDAIPAVVVVRSGDVTSPQVAHAIRGVARTAAASPCSSSPARSRSTRRDTVAEVDIPMVGDGNNSASNAGVGSASEHADPRHDRDGCQTRPPT